MELNFYGRSSFRHPFSANSGALNGGLRLYSDNRNSHLDPPETNSLPSIGFTNLRLKTFSIKFNRHLLMTTCLTYHTLFRVSSAPSSSHEHSTNGFESKQNDVEQHLCSTLTNTEKLSAYRRMPRHQHSQIEICRYPAAVLRLPDDTNSITPQSTTTLGTISVLPCHVRSYILGLLHYSKELHKHD